MKFSTRIHLYILDNIIWIWATYFKASWFIIPKALTAASRTSTTSHRSNGTTNLYSATGDGEIAFDLSLRSAFNESGEELLLCSCVDIHIHSWNSKQNKKKKKNKNENISLAYCWQNFETISGVYVMCLWGVFCVYISVNPLKNLWNCFFVSFLVRVYKSKRERKKHLNNRTHFV